MTKISNYKGQEFSNRPTPSVCRHWEISRMPVAASPRASRRNSNCRTGRYFGGAAHGLHRLTRQRPAAERPTAEPTQRWRSDCGKECANVTGKSAQSVGLRPSWALGLECTEAASSWSRETSTSHPAVAMEAQETEIRVGRARQDYSNPFIGLA